MHGRVLVKIHSIYISFFKESVRLFISGMQLSTGYPQSYPQVVFYVVLWRLFNIK